MDPALRRRPTSAALVTYGRPPPGRPFGGAEVAGEGGNTGRCSGRWVPSTGGSRSSPAQAAGIGRSTPSCSPPKGAKVVVNDLGGDVDGSGDDRQRRPSRWSTRSAPRAARRSPTPTTSPTGRADSASSSPPIEAFGDLHVLVNNAGILRDRVLVNMTEDEWDSVIRVHLKGHFVPTRHAAA